MYSFTIYIIYMQINKNWFQNFPNLAKSSYSRPNSFLSEFQISMKQFLFLFLFLLFTLFTYKTKLLSDPNTHLFLFSRFHCLMLGKKNETILLCMVNEKWTDLSSREHVLPLNTFCRYIFRLFRLKAHHNSQNQSWRALQSRYISCYCRCNMCVGNLMNAILIIYFIRNGKFDGNVKYLRERFFSMNAHR